MAQAFATTSPSSPAVVDARAEEHRLVLFSPAFHERGGIPRRARLLAGGLAARGWRVYVVTRGSSLLWFRVTRSPNLIVLEVPGYELYRTGTLLYLACAIPVGVAWGRRATAFASLKLFSPSTAAAICSRVTGRPFVALATLSGTDGEVAHLMADEQMVPRPAWKGGLFRLGMRCRRSLLRHAAFLVAQSPAGADELGRLVGPERVAVVPTPVEAVEAPPLTHAPEVVFIGRLSREKGLIGLLGAWCGVVAERADARLTFVGDGGSHEPVEDELRRLVSENPVLRQTVRFAGWVEDVTPYLARSDVFVLPSLQEGMSNALVEACAWGRVVVASDIAANRAVLGDDYPLLFPPGDVGTLTAALLRGLVNAEVRHVARQRALERADDLGLDAVIGRLEQVLESAQQGSGARPRRDGRGRGVPTVLTRTGRSARRPQGGQDLANQEPE